MIFGPANWRRARAHFLREGIVCIRQSPDPMVAQLTASLPLYADRRVLSRKTLCLSNDDSRDQPLIKRMLRNMAPLFKQIHGFPLVPGSFPLEYREYQPHSDGMGWHRDLQMYEPAQVEMVYTVFNDDALTRFEWKTREGTVQSMRPQAGDLVMVRPNGPLHRVTRMGSGTRGIIKWVGYPPGATALMAKHREKWMCPTRRSSGSTTICIILFFVVVGVVVFFVRQ